MTTPDDTPPPLSNPFHLVHAITNIKTLIPITLDIKTPNYQRWSHFFTITVGCFSLSGQLHGKPCPPNISLDDWERGDFSLQSWIIGRAIQLWMNLASLFTDNKDYRAIQLEEKFKPLKKGSSSIYDYCQTVKNIADQLTDVGHPISDKQLVLQTLHGLPNSYRTVVNLISFQTPLPTVFQTRSLLQIEETRISEPEPSPTAVLYTSKPQNSPQINQAYPNPNGRGGYSHGRGRGYGRNRDRSRWGSHMQHYGYPQFHPPPSVHLRFLTNPF